MGGNVETPLVNIALKTLRKNSTPEEMVGLESKVKGHELWRHEIIILAMQCLELLNE